MQISPDGLEFLKEQECNKDAEGKVICSLQAYAATPDEAKRNIYTIAYGNTYYLDGSPVKKDDEITQQEADNLYAGIAHEFDTKLAPILTMSLNQNQYDALFSLAYNIGIANFANSTLVRYLKAGSYQLAANEFIKWDHQNGTVLQGLLDRRIRERTLFNKDT